MTAKAKPAAEGRRQRKKRELRDRIYQTARELFLAQGFEATTVEQIAEAADVAQATFFNHFPSKNAVLSEMTQEVAARLQDLLAEQLSRQASAATRILGFGERAAAEVEAARGLAREVLIELIRTGGGPGQTFSYVHAALGPFQEILEEGRRRREVRSDLDSGFLAEMVVGAFNAAAIQWMNDPAYPLARRLRQVAAFVAEIVAPLGARAHKNTLH